MMRIFISLLQKYRYFSRHRRASRGSRGLVPGSSRRDPARGRGARASRSDGASGTVPSASVSRCPWHPARQRPRGTEHRRSKLEHLWVSKRLRAGGRGLGTPPSAATAPPTPPLRAPSPCRRFPSPFTSFPTSPSQIPPGSWRPLTSITGKIQGAGGDADESQPGAAPTPVPADPCHACSSATLCPRLGAVTGFTAGTAHAGTEPPRRCVWIHSASPRAAGQGARSLGRDPPAPGGNGAV